MIITIAQQKGGAGKSTISANLAITLKNICHEKIALIDTDPQSSLESWYQIRREKQNITNDIAFTKISGWRVSNTLASLKSKYSYIIIDSPPCLDTDTKTIIRESDFIIVPMQASMVDFYSTLKTIDIIKQENKDFRILINRYNRNIKFSKEMIQRLEHPMFDIYIGNRSIFASSLDQGLAVIECDENSIAAQEFLALAREVSHIKADRISAGIYS